VSLVHLIDSGNGKNTNPLSNVKILKSASSQVSMDDIRRWFMSEKSSVLRFHSLYNEISGLDAKTTDFITGFDEALKTTDFRQFKA
jgi:hypothetical protein